MFWEFLAPVKPEVREAVYPKACNLAAEGVEHWWAEIDALVTRLCKVGYVDGAEAVQIVEAVHAEKSEGVG